MFKMQNFLNILMKSIYLDEFGDIKIMILPNEIIFDMEIK